ncbi:hypothetical protein Tco_0412964 [Tanacetum coccineum]
MKSTVLTTYTPYPSRNIRRIRALNFTQYPRSKDPYAVHNSVSFMKEEPDIKNMTLNEYLDEKRVVLEYLDSYEEIIDDVEDDEEDTDTIEKVIDDSFRMEAETSKGWNKRKLMWKIEMRWNWKIFGILWSRT